MLGELLPSVYHMAQNSGREKLWRSGNLRKLVGKALTNCSELSLFSLI